MLWNLEFYCQTLLNNFVVKTQTFQTFTLLYLMLLVYLWFPALVLIQNAGAKERGGWVLFTKWTPDAAMAVQTAGAASGSVRNLVNASNLSVSKVGQSLHPKPFFTKFIVTTCKFNRVKAFVRFKNENWCTDLVYVDKLAKVFNGLKYLLVGQDLFDRSRDAKKWEQRIPKERSVHFCLGLQKRIDPRKLGSTSEKHLLRN